MKYINGQVEGAPLGGSRRWLSQYKIIQTSADWKLLEDCPGCWNTSSIKIPSHFLDPGGKINFFSDCSSSFFLVQSLENDKSTVTLFRVKTGENWLLWIYVAWERPLPPHSRCWSSLPKLSRGAPDLSYTKSSYTRLIIWWQCYGTSLLCQACNVPFLANSGIN